MIKLFRDYDFDFSNLLFQNDTEVKSPDFTDSDSECSDADTVDEISPFYEFTLNLSSIEEDVTQMIKEFIEYASSSPKSDYSSQSENISDYDMSDIDLSEYVFVSK